MKGLTTEWSRYGLRFVGIAPGPINNSGGLDRLDQIKNLIESLNPIFPIPIIKIFLPPSPLLSLRKRLNNKVSVFSLL